MVIFHSYVSLPEGKGDINPFLPDLACSVFAQVPPASRTRIIRYLESQVYKDRWEPGSPGSKGRAIDD